MLFIFTSNEGQHENFFEPKYLHCNSNFLRRANCLKILYLSFKSRSKKINNKLQCFHDKILSTLPSYSSRSRSAVGIIGNQYSLYAPLFTGSPYIKNWGYHQFLHFSTKLIAPYKTKNYSTSYLAFLKNLIKTMT